MKISKLQLKKKLNNPEDRKHSIIFLGMSGSGKTYWSKKLAKKFKLDHVEFDELIGNSRELANLIKDFQGRDSAEKLGNYFGKPWNKYYKSKEKYFLSIEGKFLSKRYAPSTVLDLTGSAIYHPHQMRKIAKTGLVIYLETNEEAQREMFRIFIRNPKPICWNNLFKKRGKESNEKALKRCYPMLLKYRAKLYDKYADVKIPFEMHKNAKSPEEFIEIVCRQLS
ncbi:MAG: shikimate kinase [Nanoarchaeota archaeon]|nr:shikimate kinase [Nanoarchaeota archaeon]